MPIDGRAGAHRRDRAVLTSAGPTKRPGRLVTPGLREPSGGGRGRGSQVHGSDGGSRCRPDGERARTPAMIGKMCPSEKHDPPQIRSSLGGERLEGPLAALGTSSSCLTDAGPAGDVRAIRKYFRGAGCPPSDTVPKPRNGADRHGSGGVRRVPGSAMTSPRSTIDAERGGDSQYFAKAAHFPYLASGSAIYSDCVSGCLGYLDRIAIDAPLRNGVCWQGYAEVVRREERGVCWSPGVTRRSIQRVETRGQAGRMKSRVRHA